MENSRDQRMTIKIFLGNLNSDTTSDKIRPLFEKYGQVAECDVLKNFGFVHMVNKSEANKAIAQLDGYNVDGNNIRVELSTGKKGGGGGGGKFDKKGLGKSLLALARRPLKVLPSAESRLCRIYAVCDQHPSMLKANPDRCYRTAFQP